MKWSFFPNPDRREVASKFGKNERNEGKTMRALSLSPSLRRPSIYFSYFLFLFFVFLRKKKRRPGGFNAKSKMFSIYGNILAFK
jgi:hypothetical protein